MMGHGLILLAEAIKDLDLRTSAYGIFRVSNAEEKTAVSLGRLIIFHFQNEFSICFLLNQIIVEPLPARLFGERVYQ